MIQERELTLKDIICKFDNVQLRKEGKGQFWVSGHQRKERNDYTDVLLEQKARNSRNVDTKELANIACVRIKEVKDVPNFLYGTAKPNLRC